MSDAKPLVAVVTGASRGAGRGIAVALGQHGATVYVTGRTTTQGSAALPGTIHETAAAITAAGGHGIALAVDHADDAQVAAAFAQIAAEQDGIDILVNNVAIIHDELTDPREFWARPLHLGDILNVGLRSQYVASWHAAPLLLRRGRGLVAFTSSFGAVCFMHGPAYGAQKAGVDKLAADMAVDFRPHGIAAVSLWMGPLLTERAKATYARKAADGTLGDYATFAAQAETPEFSGHLLHRLYEDPDIMTLSGQTLIGAELAERYNMLDEGKRPPSYRAMLGEPRIPHPAVIR
jgi:NAD(P)-dependent dehydrogenase (short-subunit alcohol dehydrogenase family)